MSIQVACQCGGRFMAPPHLAGKRVSCPNCGSPITVSAPAPAPAPLEETILVTCLCGQQFRAQPHLAGKTVRCGVCQSPIQVPSGLDAGALPQDDFFAPLPANDPLMQQPNLNSFGPSPGTNVNSAPLKTRISDQMLASAGAERRERDEEMNAWSTGKIITGVLMIVGSLVWFGFGLLGGVIFFYPPIMFVLGIIALCNGLAHKFSR
ncbi:MAG TPA: hypothetical protein DCY79_17715 [Planctomycetaceae bacterium]|nr:hypothetical protein [Planctomycetaceae bacterium]